MSWRTFRRSPLVSLAIPKKLWPLSERKLKVRISRTQIYEKTLITFICVVLRIILFLIAKFIAKCEVYVHCDMSIWTRKNLLFSFL